MTHFTNITSAEPVAAYLAETLAKHLAAGEHVLWLVPGGSSIAVAAAVSQKLAGRALHNLTVTLTDERYGEPGHADSNWRQLTEAGFALPGATLLPVLTGADRATTVDHFATILREQLAVADYRLGFFGIGADGHTAGILPGSPAARATELAAGYDAGPFQRLTMTFPAVKRLDEAVVYAVGEAKWPVIDELAGGKVSLIKQPAQALKSVHTLTVFNDHKGDTL